MKIAKITQGGTAAVNFALTAASTSTQASVQRYLAEHQHLRTG
jgi:hypothetical protein